MNDDAIIDRPVTRLPPRTTARTAAQLAGSAVAHLVAVAAIGIVAALTPRGPADAERLEQVRPAPVELPRVVFVAPAAIRGLDDEAINAVRQWRFAPGTLAGSPVDVQVVVVVDFRIF